MSPTSVPSSTAINQTETQLDHNNDISETSVDSTTFSSLSQRSGTDSQSAETDSSTQIKKRKLTSKGC
jgi:hypothetical protein